MNNNKQVSTGNGVAPRSRAEQAKIDLWNKLNRIDNMLLMTGASEYCFATHGKENAKAQRVYARVSKAQGIIAKALKEIS